MEYTKQRAINVVVASLKSWDGTRILGVFETEDIAVECCKKASIDTECEDFNLDFIEMNKVSKCQTIVVDNSTFGKGFRRIHVYEANPAENITSK